MSEQESVSVSYPSVVKVDADGQVISWWNPKVTGDWGVDHAKGREYAREVCEFIAREDAPVILRAILAEFEDHMRAVETAFINEIAVMAARACS